MRDDAQRTLLCEAPLCVAATPTSSTPPVRSVPCRADGVPASGPSSSFSRMCRAPAELPGALHSAPGHYFYPAAQRTPCRVIVVSALQRSFYGALEGGRNVLAPHPGPGRKLTAPSKTAKNKAEKLTVVYLKNERPTLCLYLSFEWLRRCHSCFVLKLKSI